MYVLSVPTELCCTVDVNNTSHILNDFIHIQLSFKVLHLCEGAFPKIVRANTNSIVQAV